MKGQSNIEYIVAMIIFIVITIYISFQIAAILPYYHTNSFEDRLNSECFSLSEMILKDSVTPYGFAKTPYELNSTKMLEFNDTCNANLNNPAAFEVDYSQIRESMTLPSERDFLLEIWVNSTLNFECGRRFISTQSQVSSIQRYAETDNQLTKITLSVW